MPDIRRIFVANRGEIAIRVIRTCRNLGIETVVATSTIDRFSMPAMMADRSICVGGDAPGASYLQAGALIAAALASNCDAVHPGYGFLAESQDFARLCQENGLIFIGPRAELLELFGNKVAARGLAVEAGISVLPGTGLITEIAEARAAAAAMGYPVLAKGVAGGGGKGMHIIEDEAHLARLLALARAEVGSAFHDSGIYLEKFVRNARHVEVQVVGDSHGHVIHLGDRDCSVQRRYQKLVEEAPAPNLPQAIREQLHGAALDLCSAAELDNVATAEFLVDTEERAVYFLEVNPRIQVEHGVTELITGFDIVALQIRAASGADLGISQDDVQFTGCAVEVRLNAESPMRDFQPSPGRITAWRMPTGGHVRVDTHCYPSYLVPPFYDSLLAKLLTVGVDREAARRSMLSCLERLDVRGVDTTREILQCIIGHPDFIAVSHSTGWLDAALQQIIRKPCLAGAGLTGESRRDERG